MKVHGDWQERAATLVEEDGTYRHLTEVRVLRKPNLSAGIFQVFTRWPNGTTETKIGTMGTLEDWANHLQPSLPHRYKWHFRTALELAREISVSNQGSDAQVMC